MPITNAYEDLSQSLRMYLEAHYRAHTDLLFVDRDEAVGNMELTFTGILNSFHSLYDAIIKKLGRDILDWYGAPELCIVLAVRNARHHNAANKIRGLYNYHIQTSKTPEVHKTYTMVDFVFEHDYINHTDYYLSWDDLSNFLDMGREITRLRQDSKDLLYRYINANRFYSYAKKRNLNTESLMINFIPLLINAMRIVTTTIYDQVVPRTTEGKAFVEIFNDRNLFSTKKHTVKYIQVFLPK